MLTSMTGYASASFSNQTYDWTWDLRSVNNKGLDLRVRAPDWVTGLDQSIKKFAQTHVARGSVQINLKLSQVEGAAQVNIDSDLVETMLGKAAQIAEMADGMNVMLHPLRVHDILHSCTTRERNQTDEEIQTIAADIMATLPEVLASFSDMRANEGTALTQVLTQQLDQIEHLTQAAQDSLGSRAAQHEASFNAALQRLRATEIDPERLAQEMAILAVKSDVTEELDRLRGHVQAARDLMASAAPVGRKLDFLMQEFNREANTLCSKAASKNLTAIGLDLKVTIDQMREQIQNVE